MTTANEDRQFIDYVIETSLLGDAVDWIGNTLTPSEVFDEDVLVEWSTDNGYIKEKE